MQKNNLKSAKNRRSQLVRFGCVCFFVSILNVIFLGNTYAKAGDEYGLKAAFVLNFAKFAEWPSGTLGSDDTVNLCVLGDLSLKPAFKNVEGKKIENRKLHVRFIDNFEDLAECNILFVAGHRNEAERIQLFTEVKNRPILTIGEMEHFVHQGGVINLVDRAGKLRFEISPDNALEQGGISISSRLLKLAIIVEGK